jgi:hypothetical protein
MRISSFSSHARRHLIWLLMLLLLAATLVWALNSVNIIQGSWATTLNAFFTGTGVILALLQWHAQVQPTDASAAEQGVLGKKDAMCPYTQNTTNKRKGTLVIYTPRTWRGTPLHLMPGLQETALSSMGVEAISTVVGRRSKEQLLFVCSFPAVPPGHYTLIAPLKQRQIQITVRPGYLSEIDWR